MCFLKVSLQAPPLIAQQLLEKEVLTGITAKASKDRLRVADIRIRGKKDTLITRAIPVGSVD